MGHQQTPSFQLELPLRADAEQAHHFLAHLEAARRLYNAILGEAMRRLRLYAFIPSGLLHVPSRVSRRRSAPLLLQLHANGLGSRNTRCLLSPNLPTMFGCVVTSMPS